MLKWMVEVIAGMNYVGVALLMAIENVILPMPSEVIMPLSGFLAARGHMTLVGVIIAGSVGSALGALPVYAIGRAFGKQEVTRWVDRHGKWLLLRGRDLVKAGEHFERHGTVAVFLGQLLPGVRGLISLPAGFAKMQVLMFELMNFLGTLFWCAVLAWLGYFLGANFERVHEFLGPASWGILGLGAVALVVWLIRRRRNSRRGGRAVPPDSAHDRSGA